MLPCCFDMTTTITNPPRQIVVRDIMIFIMSPLPRPYREIPPLPLVTHRVTIHETNIGAHEKNKQVNADPFRTALTSNVPRHGLVFKPRTYPYIHHQVMIFYTLSHECNTGPPPFFGGQPREHGALLQPLLSATHLHYRLLSISEDRRTRGEIRNRCLLLRNIRQNNTPLSPSNFILALSFLCDIVL